MAGSRRKGLSKRMHGALHQCACSSNALARRSPPMRLHGALLRCAPQPSTGERGAPRPPSRMPASLELYNKALCLSERGDAICLSERGEAIFLRGEWGEGGGGCSRLDGLEEALVLLLRPVPRLRLQGQERGSGRGSLHASHSACFRARGGAASPPITPTPPLSALRPFLFAVTLRVARMAAALATRSLGLAPSFR